MNSFPDSIFMLMRHTVRDHPRRFTEKSKGRSRLLYVALMMNSRSRKLNTEEDFSQQRNRVFTTSRAALRRQNPKFFSTKPRISHSALRTSFTASTALSYTVVQIPVKWLCENETLPLLFDAVDGIHQHSLQSSQNFTIDVKLGLVSVLTGLQRAKC